MTGHRHQEAAAAETAAYEDAMTAAGDRARCDGGTAGCAACGNHPTVMVLCALALSLLAMAWRLPRPRLHLAPPSGRLVRPFSLAVVRWRMPWSLAELWVYRT